MQLPCGVKSKQEQEQESLGRRQTKLVYFLRIGVRSGTLTMDPNRESA